MSMNTTENMRFYDDDDERGPIQHQSEIYHNQINFSQSHQLKSTKLVLVLVLRTVSVCTINMTSIRSWPSRRKRKRVPQAFDVFVSHKRHVSPISQTNRGRACIYYEVASNRLEDETIASTKRIELIIRRCQKCSLQ